jgi:hypothetical protein
MDHYELQLIETHFAARPKPATKIVQGHIFPEAE